MVLIVAGSDPSGGAGLQADLKTVSALGGYGMTAVTAITVQNTCQVKEVYPVPVRLVIDQIRVCVRDIQPQAVKVGLLPTAEVAAAVADELAASCSVPVVVDPVVRASVGSALAEEDVLAALTQHLFPLASVVTPNVSEAERLTGRPIPSLDAARAAAEQLKAMGPKAVVVKGGHLPGAPVDILYDGQRFWEFRAERIETAHDHGTGCCFSSALAFGLARGLDVVDATWLAHRCVRRALEHGLPLGQGRGPVDPMACYGEAGEASDDDRDSEPS